MNMREVRAATDFYLSRAEYLLYLQRVNEQAMRASLMKPALPPTDPGRVRVIGGVGPGLALIPEHEDARQRKASN